MGRRIRDPETCLNFLAIFGPISVMFLLILWGSLVILAFALIDYGLGVHFQTEAGPVNFGGLHLHERIDVLDARARRRHVSRIRSTDSWSSSRRRPGSSSSG